MEKNSENSKENATELFFEKNSGLPVVIEGPEFTVDRSYKWVTDCADLQTLEKGFESAKMVDTITQRLTEGVAAVEFRILRRITETQFHTEDLYECEPEDCKYNRYPDVLPLKQTRVTINKEPDALKTSYINANYINSLCSEYRKAFIATQAPLANTTETFWDMVYQQKVEIIVNLCENLVKSHSGPVEYFPENEGEIMDIWSAELQVKYIKKEEISSSICRREFLLTARDGTSQTVQQYHLFTWPDNAGISAEIMGEIQKLLEVVLTQMRSKKPVIVHCSAGCGRTGTFIAICNIVHSLEKLYSLPTSSGSEMGSYSLTPRVSVFSTVRRLREQRWTMVKTESQYKSIYEFLKYLYCGK